MSRRQYFSARPITAPKGPTGTSRGTSGETFACPEEASPVRAEVMDTSIDRRHHRHTSAIVAAPISTRSSAASTRPSARSIGTENRAPSGVQARTSVAGGSCARTQPMSRSEMRCIDSEKA